jgi:vacuolar protein sorting-associated protein 45
MIFQSHLATIRSQLTIENKYLYDITNGIKTSLLAIRSNPHIRYVCNSNVSQWIAKHINENIESEESSDTLLLILDTKNDPVTPLLTQWTYEAMVHELLGLNDQKISHKDDTILSQSFKKDDIIIDSEDIFWRKHRFDNIAELEEAIKQELNEYKQKHQKQAKLDTLEDMQKFVEQY